MRKKKIGSSFSFLFQKKVLITEILLLFFVFSTNFVSAQLNTLLHKRYAEMAPGMHNIFRRILKSKDSVVLGERLDSLRTYVRQHHDKNFELEIDLFELFAKSNFYHKAQESSISAYKKLIKQAEKEHIWHVELNTTRALAEYYWKFVKDYEVAFEYYLILDNELMKINPKDYPQMARDYNQIGESYFFFRDYKKAKKYFRKAFSLPETVFNTSVRASALNTMGMCFQREQDYDSSDYYFKKALKTKFEGTKSTWIGIVKGNLGANLYKRKQYIAAIPLLEFCIEKAIKDNDFGSVSSASTVLASIYLKQNKLPEAWQQIEQARNSIGKTNDIGDFRLLYPIISNWYGKSGKDELSELYLDSTILAINKYEEDFNAIKVLNAQQTINKRENLLMKANFNLAQQKRINQRNFIALIALILLMVIFIWYFLLKRKRQRLELKTLKTENRLKLAHQHIHQFKEKINQQNSLFAKISEELSQIKETNQENHKLVERSIWELRSATIITESDWIQFRQDFMLVYPSFIQQLKEKCPTLTEAEIRYLMLAKLQLIHKEMAQILGISADSVRVTWNRTRKKLNGSLKDTPQTLLAKFD